MVILVGQEQRVFMVIIPVSMIMHQDQLPAFLEINVILLHSLALFYFILGSILV